MLIILFMLFILIFDCFGYFTFVPLELCHPVGEDREGHNYQERPGLPLGVPEVADEGNGLKSLAKAHLIA